MTQQKPNTPADDESQNQNQQPTPPAGAQTPDSGLMIPKTRFDEVNQKAKALAAKVAEFEKAEADRLAAEAAAEKERLKEQGKFQEIATKAEADRDAIKAQFDELSAKAAAMEEALKTLLESEMKDVPDYVVPLLENLDVAARLKYLAENKSKWTRVKTVPPTPAAGTQPAIDDEERRKRAWRPRF